MKRFLILFLLLTGPLYATELREDTATNVTLKWVDATDGVTAETTYATSSNMVCTVVKHNGTTATTLAVGSTNATAFISNGVAYLGLTTTDTSTPGRLDLYCSCGTTCITGGAAPFEAHYDVLPQVTWDQKYTGDIATAADIAAAVHETPVPGAFASGTAGYNIGNMATVVWSHIIETGFTGADLMKLMSAAIVGPASGFASGNVIFKDVNNSKNRVTGTANATGRSSMTYDVTP